MTDREFALLDELYFVISFEEICEQLGWPEVELAGALHAMTERGWVRCFQGEADADNPLLDWPGRYAQFHYLATKEGLLAHNTDA